MLLMIGVVSLVSAADSMENFSGAAPYVALCDLAFDPAVQDWLDVDAKGRQELLLLRGAVSEARNAAGRICRSPDPFDRGAWREFGKSRVESPAQVAEYVRTTVGPARHSRLRGLHLALRGAAAACDREWNGLFDRQTAGRVFALSAGWRSEMADPDTDADLIIGKRRGQLRSALSAVQRAALDRLTSTDVSRKLLEALATRTCEFGPFPEDPLSPGEIVLEAHSHLCRALACDTLLDALNVDALARKAMRAEWNAAFEARDALLGALFLFRPEEQDQLRRSAHRRSDRALHALTKAMLSPLEFERREDVMAAFAQLEGHVNACCGTVSETLGLTPDQKTRFGEVFGRPLNEYNKKYPQWCNVPPEIRSDPEKVASYTSAFEERFRKYPPKPLPDMAGSLAELRTSIFTPAQRRQWDFWQNRKLPPGLMPALEQAVSCQHWYPRPPEPPLFKVFTLAQ